MRKNLIIAAAVSTFAMPAIAAPLETPYALSAVHADFLEQLERAAERPGEIGDAARAAADLMEPHNARQERLVLPWLGAMEAAMTGRSATRNDAPDQNSLQADISQLYNDDVDLVTALVELYAAAEDAGDHQIARIAERMIWHEMSDLDVLYPAVVLVESAMKTRDPDDPQRPGSAN